MSHERTSYTVEKPRLSVLDRAKKTGVTALALVTGGAMLGGLSGCGGEKAGASEVPTSPVATAPKTPEVTKTPEKAVALSFEAKAYEQRLAPVNLKGKTEEEMTAMWADGLPDAEKDPEKFGQYMYAGIDALAQACADSDLIAPIDSDGVARETDDLQNECRPYYKAALNGIFGKDSPNSDHIGTLVNRMMYRNAGQSALIHWGHPDDIALPKNITKYSYTTKLNSLDVQSDGTIMISMVGYDLDGPDVAWASKYSRASTSAFGETAAKKSAITEDSLEIAYNPKTGEYNDMAKCVKDSSGTPCK